MSTPSLPPSLRLRKKDLKFFESLTSLEKSHRKSSDRLKSCQKRTAVGRNDYLLAIETTNAHLKRHNDHDLPQLMQVRAKGLPVSRGTLFSSAGSSLGL